MQYEDIMASLQGAITQIKGRKTMANIEAAIVTDTGAISVIIDGKSHVADKDHPRYAKIKEALNENDADRILQLINVSSAINDYVSSSGKVSISNGVLHYKFSEVDSRPIANSLVDRIVSMMREGFRPDPIVLFLENLMQNPSHRALNELYPFMVGRQHYRPLPITQDGYFLAYKAVRSDFLDWHKGVVDNTPPVPGGPPRIIEMPRNLVDDDWGVDCSEGYHVGSLSYLASFHQNEGKRIVVKVNPRDVVSVPRSETNKCRVCRYEVLYEYTDELPGLVYGSDGISSPTLYEGHSSSQGGRSDNDALDVGGTGAWAARDEDFDDDDDDDCCEDCGCDPCECDDDDDYDDEDSDY